jgi:DNA repair protein RecO (recombination protein O)
MSRLSTAAIVLRRREYGDFDLIVTALSRDHGKMTLIAKSAKKSSKRFPGILEPFNYLHITFRETQHGKGMPVLEEASLVRTPARIRSDFARAVHASYWVECIGLWMQEGQVRADLFELLRFVLGELDANRIPPDMLGVLFQMRFIGQEGFQPILARCACCQTGIEQLVQDDFCVDLGKGGVVCNRCPPSGPRGLRLSKGTLKQLLWIADGDLVQARRARFSSQTLAEARAFLEAFVPYHIGRMPKSLRILQHIRQ